MLHYEKGSDAKEDQEGKAPIGLAIDLGEEIGGRDVESDTPGQWEGVLELTLEHCGEQDACKSSSPEETGREESGAATFATREHKRGDGEAFRELMEEDGEENSRAKPRGDKEAGGDGHAIEKRVNDKTEQDGVTRVCVADLVTVGLFAEVEMRSERVLEEVHEEEADENEKQRLRGAAQSDGFGDDFEEGHSKHIAGTEGQEGLQEATGPFAVDNEVATDEVSCGSN